MSTDDSTHTDDPLAALHTDEWEAEMEELLEETDHDTELGIEMAKDAQRLVAGQIDEEEFHAKYHEAVIDEFGVDDRPIDDAIDTVKEAGGDAAAALEAFEDDDGTDRRDAMKKFGVGAAALSLAGWATADAMDDEPQDQAAVAAAQEDDEDDLQWGMVIDLDKCDGCLACVVACEQENGTGDGENWMYVFAYEEEDQDDMNYLVRTCQMCSDAPCEKVCPTTARHTRSSDGLVLTDYDVCIGCRYCQVACPYGVNYFQWGEPETPMDEIDDNHTHDKRGQWVDSRPPRGVMGKCTMCPSRQDGNMGDDMVGTTACEDACSMDAIHFGNMEDPDSDPNQYLEQVREERASANELQDDDADEWADRPDHTASTFRLLEEIGTKPNVVFVGNEPSSDAEQVEGPVSYEDVGQVDNRKEALDDGTFAGGVTE